MSPSTSGLSVTATPARSRVDYTTFNTARPRFCPRLDFIASLIVFTPHPLNPSSSRHIAGVHVTVSHGDVMEM
ncbi:hypothetical protein J6590_053995 [Homalodisca vitripennis]|nr:hypothetical protein J6590_053995 [Homalodisca vitripennis]